MTNDQIKGELIKELKANERLAALLILHARNRVNSLHKTTFPVHDPIVLNRLVGQAQGVTNFIDDLTKTYAAFHEASDLDLLKRIL